MILLFFDSLISLLTNFVITLPIFNELTDLQKVKSYINDSNRLTLFILGTTVSANIYLYNTKTKISSSSIWDSKQLFLLFFNLSVNLVTFVFGFHLIHSELIFNSTISIEELKILLVIYFLLKGFSYLLFALTMWNFIKSFWLTLNLKKLFKQNNKLLFPKRRVRLIKNYKLITKSADNNFRKFLDLIKFKNPKVISTIILFQRIHLVSSLTRNFIYGGKYINRICYYCYIFCINNHPIIEQTSFLTQRNFKNLGLKTEILFQNLEYVISSNSDRGMNEYCKEWNAFFSKMVIMLFHINGKDEEEKGLIELYRLLLHNHSKLISLTASSFENRQYHKDFIKSLLNALAYKEETIEEFMSPVQFEKRTEELEKVFFEELFSLLINLMQKKNFEILTLLQTDELNLNTFISSQRDNKKYYGSKGRKRRYEQLFISTLFRMVELNITENLTTLMAIILSLRDESIQSIKNNMESVKLSRDKNKDLDPIQNDNESKDFQVNLSYENREGLIYAAIKANEVEDYKTVGYIIKVLAANIPHESLVNLFTDIYLTNVLSNNRSIKYDTGLYKVDFNKYSFDYCLNKTFILINAQYFFKKDIEKMIDLHFIFDDIDCAYFIKKIMLKQKEYGMISLDENRLNEFEYYIDNEIRV